MRYLLAAFLLASGAAHAQAQPQPQTPPRFEVASVRPSTSADRRTLFNMFNLASGGQFTASNVTVKSLLRMAYGIKDFQIAGGPSWTGSDLFDVAAKPDGPVKPDQFGLMLQSLLADRFGLVVRRETKDMPVYALVVDKNGPKFKDAHESDPVIPQLRDRPDLPNAGGRRAGVSIIRRGRLTTQMTNMTGLAANLANIVGRTVIDKTGLAGMYDLMLEWSPDENQVANFQSIGVPESFGAPPPDWQGPTLFTALEEQLGLKLESQKAPVEMFQIERVERPTEN
jgi:uncharacterized protein (TIGR03435 family)